MSSIHRNPAWRVSLALASLIALPALGCTNEAPAPATGSWVEIVDVQESEDALDVEHLPAFVAVEELEDRLVFTFDGASPLRAGHVVAASAPGRAGYVRRVLSVTVLADGRVEAMTEAADLGDYFTAFHVIFHYDPVRVDEATIPTIPGMAAASLGGGCEDTTPCDLSGGRSFGSETAGCTAAYGASLYAGPFVESDFSADFDFDANLGFGWRGPSWHPEAYLDLEGEVRAGFRLRASAAAQLTCNADFAALLGGGEAPTITLAYIQLGPVPLTVTATPILRGEFSAAADVGEFHAEAGATASATVRIGMDGGDPVLEHEFSFVPFADVETARAGALSAHAQVTAGVDVEFRVGWDFGPVSLGGYASAALTGTLGADFTADVAGCSWDVDVPWSADVQFAAGFEAGVFGLSWNPEHTWDSINLARGSLGSLSGSLPWCGMTPEMCPSGGAVCHDDLLDNGVCEGMMGFQSCGGMGSPYYQRCACTAGGWVSCGSCMPG